MKKARVIESDEMNAAPIEINWHPGLSIYASEPYLKTVGDEYGWLGGIDESGNLRCILPFTIIRKAIIRMVRFQIETIPLSDDFDVMEEKSFLNSAVEYFRATGADMIIPATTNAIFRTYPDQAVAAPYGTLKINLNRPEEILWDHLHSKHRNVIRNATKKNVRILSGGEHSDLAYRLVRDTFKRSSLSFMSLDAFLRLIRGLGPNVRILIADYQGAPQGCAIIPFSNHSAYYVYGGTVPEPVTGAMNLLQWEAIRYFRESGVQFYDFCGVRINPDQGSKQAGLMMFKERFGAQLFQGYMWKCSLHPMKSAVYSLGVRLLRGGDIVDAEHHKLKNLRTPSPSPESGLREP
jgi:hypothetical protein